MTSPNVIALSKPPMISITDSASKTLAILESFADKTTKRTADVVHAPETIAKSTLQSISAILLGSGLDAAKTLADTISAQFYFLLSAINQAEDPRHFVTQLIVHFDPLNRNKSFSVARTTVEDMIPSMTRKEMDQEIERHYQDNMHDLSTVQNHAPKIAIAIDDTCFQCHPQHLNGAYGYITVGQQTIWERGLYFPAMYDLTHQQFLGCHHQDYRETLVKSRSCDALIREIQEKSQMIRTTGSSVAVFEADRLYFNGELFAAATLNRLDLAATEADSPRVIVPRKFNASKESFKWEYLLNEHSAQVFSDFFSVPKNTPLFKRTKMQIPFACEDGENYRIPYGCVALVDEYQAKKKRTFLEVQKEAQLIQTQLKDLEQQRIAAETEYISYASTILPPNKMPKVPSYGRGKKRSKFCDKQDAKNFHLCWELHTQEDAWTEKKTAVLKCVIFFGISLRVGEDPTQNPEKFIALAKDYHERWGIENGFRDVKQAFLRPVRQTKPTMRQFFLMIGMILYGRWHVDRTIELISCVRTHYFNKKSYHPKRPWVRRKLEREVHNTTTARSYLIQLWGQALESITKNLINQCT